MNSFTQTDWRVETVSDAARIVTGTGRQKFILARLCTKQIPEQETVSNAYLMAASPGLLRLLRRYVSNDHVHGGCDDLTSEAEAFIEAIESNRSKP